MQLRHDRISGHSCARTLQSTECQNAHWRIHKAHCRRERERRAQAEEVEYHFLSDLSVTPAAQAAKHSAALPTQMYHELRAFADKFMPALLITGYSSLLRPAHTKASTPMLIPLLFVLLERLPDEDLPTYAWSRFRVGFVGDMEPDHLVDFFHDERVRRLVPQPDGRAPMPGEARMTVFLSTVCYATTPSIPVNFTAQVTLAKDQVTDADAQEDWANWFKLFVQQTCGHPLSLPTSPETRSDSTTC